MHLLLKLALIFGTKAAVVYGITGIEITPALTQTTWATGYVGALYTVTISPAMTLDFEWTVTLTSAMTENIFMLSSADCANINSVTSGGFSASCNGSATTLSAAQILTSAFTISLTARASGAVTTILTTEVNPTTCQLQQEFATLITSTTVNCGYNCIATFQCIDGYTTSIGTDYTAICNSFANLESENACTPAIPLLAATAPTTSLFWWEILLIVIGIIMGIGLCIGGCVVCINSNKISSV